jgi:hypothetical protein
MNTERPPAVGIEIIEGLPGSGKSFFAMKRLIDTVRIDKRPIYTNLPVRWRVFRQWLRNRGREIAAGKPESAQRVVGEALANLIVPLTREHFERFIERQKKLSDMRDAYKTRCFQLKRPFRSGRFERHVQNRRFLGPHILHGPNANWIPFAARIVIDEAHKWYSMQNQKNETASLLAYLTMHRHHVHDIWLITQDAMQVSISFRRLARHYWRVRERGDDPIAWGVKLKDIGFRGFAYERYTAEALEARSKEMSAPSEMRTIFPWLPSERWIFRLYESYTHVGSPRQMRKQLQAVREAAGILAEPEQVIEPLTMREVMRMSRTGVLAIAAGVALFTLGRISVTGLIDTKPQPGPSVAGVSSLSAKPWYEGVKLSGLVDGGAIVGGRLVAPRQRVGGVNAVLLSCNGESAAFEAADNVWLWKLGEGQPRSVGSISEVRDILRRKHIETGGTIGRSVDSSAPRTSPALGPAQGDGEPVRSNDH